MALVSTDTCLRIRCSLRSRAHKAQPCSSKWTDGWKDCRPEHPQMANRLVDHTSSVALIDRSVRITAKSVGSVISSTVLAVSERSTRSRSCSGSRREVTTL